MAFNDLYSFDLEKGVKSLPLYHSEKWMIDKYYSIIYVISVTLLWHQLYQMKGLFENIKQKIKQLKRLVENNSFAKISLGISIVLILKKISTLRFTDKNQAMVIL